MAPGANDNGPAALRYVLAGFYFLAALGAARYARRRWYELPDPKALTPIAYWPYSTKRWQNVMRAYSWGTLCAACGLLAVAVQSAFPSAKWVTGVLALVTCAFAILFLGLITFGRPRRLLSPHF